MKVTIKISLIVFYLFIVFFTKQNFHKDAYASTTGSAPPSKELTLVIEAQKNIVEYGDEVEIGIKIQNNTDREIVICAVPSSGINKFTHHFENESETFNDEFIISEITPQRSDFISIAPNSKKFLLNTSFDKDYLYASGSWSIQLSQEHNFTGEDLGIKSWTGIVQSNMIDIEVESNLVLEATVEVSKIGEPNDAIDAYVIEKFEQFYFVRFHVDKVTKGKYSKNTLGVRLHSPSVTFGIVGEKSIGKKYRLFLNRETLSDGRNILLVQPNSKSI